MMRSWIPQLIFAATLLGKAEAQCTISQSCPNKGKYNAKWSQTCQVYKRGDAKCLNMEYPLGEAVGWIVVVGFGVMFTILTVLLSRYEYVTLGTTQSSEQFNTAGRNVGPGLTAAVIVSQWTWAATLLMSSNMGWRVGVSGPFWYASGATIQILLFAVLAIQVKRRASHMHTFMEIVKARFGTFTHCVMICFALATNIIVTSMLLLGGAGTIADLTGMSSITAAFLIPILSCWIYTMYGGLRATFFASYVHTTVIFLMLIIFTFSVYAGSGEQDLWGSPSKVHKSLERAVMHGFSSATFRNSQWISGSTGPNTFEGLGAIMQNDGMCYKTLTGANTNKKCGYSEQGKDSPCCRNIPDTATSFGKNQYCRSDTDNNCVSVSSSKHFKSGDCAADEVCVTSFLTMGSTIGLIFGITNIVGNFGTVFVDQSYWQSAVAAKPKSAVLGFLIGGMVWFAVPFCMATTNGLAGRALTMWKDGNVLTGPSFITENDSSVGLTPARVLSKVLGSGGAFILLLQLFMAITSTGSAEIIAVSSILTYDVYYEYINPELKMRREKLRRIFYNIIQGFTSANAKVDLFAQPDKEMEIRASLATVQIPKSSVQEIINALIREGFFEVQPSDNEVRNLGVEIAAACQSDQIVVPDLYSAVNKAVSSNNIEGPILLRVSKFFTGLFAVFMGFLAVFLLTLGLSLGHVYMSMGCLVGSAVGPAAVTILMERANGKAVAAGALIGLLLAIMGWVARAADEFGEVKYETLMADWPWVIGNLCAIIGGGAIAVGGSLIMPDNEFKWAMLNERIALVDDVEPPKDSKLETDDRLNAQVKIAIVASVALTVILLILWPIPMHLGAGVFSEGGFTVWVAIEIIWALLGGATIIILPALELVMTFMGKDKIDTSKLETLDLKISI